MDYFYIIFKLMLGMVLVISLLLILSRITSKNLSKINQNKYIKIIETKQIAKNTYVMVLKVGDKGYLLSTGDGKTEKLDVISKEEIEKIEQLKISEKEKVQDIYDGLYNMVQSKSIKLIKRFKKDEKE